MPDRRAPTTFRHAGDLGDIIYSLPAVRHFGGGEMLLESASFTRVPLSPDRWSGVDLLLKEQPYITGVREYRRGEYATFNLNDFRGPMFSALKMGQGRETSLCDWMLETHSVPKTAREKPWLAVEPLEIAPVVFNRSGAGREQRFCYHNWKFPWHAVWDKYGAQAVFIGTPEEYEMFRLTCGEVPYYRTANLLEAARVIAGAKLFVGNQSVCHAIAEGLKQRILLEVWPTGPNCLFQREGVTHGWDEKVKLPKL